MERGLERIVEHIKSDKCKNIAFLTGAGISVSAGIPDFRSPGGMYDTLRPDLLTATPDQREAMSNDPTTVVCWDLFKENQLCYLELRRPFILGIAEQKWKATPSHWFIKLLHEKGKLRRLFTQNIDGLDYQLNLPKEKIVGVHGTLGVIKCEFCGANYPMEEFQTQVRTKIKDIYKTDGEAPAESSTIPCIGCQRPGVKPATVLYGRALPREFTEYLEEDSDEIDLLFVIGTSLTVFPANTLVNYVSKNCLRVIIDREPVGKMMGVNCNNLEDSRDVYLKGSADHWIYNLVDKLGWSDEFRNLCPPGLLSSSD